jgi:hypothetical protein
LPLKEKLSMAPNLSMKYGAVLASVLIVCLMLPACESLPMRQSSPPPVDDLDSTDNDAAMLSEPPPPELGLQLSPEQRFSDIPLPTGLKNDLDRTYVFESKTLQIGRMVYTTRDDVNALAQFFVRECPAADWQLESITQAAGADLVFRKSGKRLSITIRDLGVSRGRELIINMTPEGGG